VEDCGGDGARGPATGPPAAMDGDGLPELAKRLSPVGFASYRGGSSQCWLPNKMKNALTPASSINCEFILTEAA